MWLTITKFAVTALVVVIASEFAKSSGRVGAFVAAMPLVTLLVMTWMWVERQAVDRIADHAAYTFWYVLPTLPMFLLVPWLLRRGVAFGWTLGAGIALTVVCVGVTALAAKRFGVQLLG